MMRIALLVPTIDQIGGAERQVLLLAAELAARGHCVTIVALSGNGKNRAAELACAGISYLSLGMRRAWIDPKGWARYLAWARIHRPEVVHAHLAHATWFARCARVLAPMPVLVDTIHTTHTGSAFRRWGYRLTGWLTDAVTCVSSPVAAAVLAARMASRERLSILPNGIPVPPVASIRARNEASSGQFQWIAVGRLTPVKDYPTLLCAFASLARQPRLTILGAGPEEGALRQVAAQLGIEDRLQLAGFVDPIQPQLAKADAFVLSSLWEGLPVSVLEASAAGLPVVATDGPGTREAMVAGVTGILTPVGDAAALAAAMEEVMAMSGAERRALGERGRQWVETRFALSAIAGQWERLYSQLLAVRPKASRLGRSRA